MPHLGSSPTMRRPARGAGLLFGVAVLAAGLAPLGPYPAPSAAAGSTAAGSTAAGSSAEATVRLDAAPAAATRYTIFGTARQRVRTLHSTRTAQVGTIFVARRAGRLESVRFYQAAGTRGRRTVAVYSASGRRLAVASTSRGSSAAGWRQITLRTPVKLAAGATYIVTYANASHRYAYQASTFARGRVRATSTLVAVAGAVSSTGRVSTGSHRSANYLIDVQFTPTPAPHAPAPRASTPASEPAAPTAPRPAPAVVPVGGCVGNPSGCGYPDASTTGVPAGTALRSVPGQVSSGPGWSFSGGTLSVTGTGAVLQGLAVNGSIDVSASNVVISKVRVVQTGESWGIGLRHTKNVTIQDSEISSPAASGGDRLLVGIKDVYGDASGTKVLRTDVWHASTGVQIHAGLIQDSYIHDPGYASGDHLNGITSNGSFGETLTIEHNTVLNSYGQTDAISLFEDFSVQANRVIDNNLVAGGGYTIYGGANPGGKATSNIKITNNRFSRMYFPDGGSYGPYTAYASGSGNTWSGNVWDDTGKAVN